MNLDHAWWEQWVYGRPETQQGIITPANTNFQLMRIPYSNPDNAKTTILAIHLSNSQASAAVVKIWDQDLTDLSSNTQLASTTRTPTTGTGGAITSPLLVYNVPANGDVIAEVVTRPYCQGGIAAQSTQTSMFYSIQVVHQGMG